MNWSSLSLGDNIEKYKGGTTAFTMLMWLWGLVGTPANEMFKMAPKAAVHCASLGHNTEQWNAQNNGWKGRKRGYALWMMLPKWEILGLWFGGARFQVRQQHWLSCTTLFNLGGIAPLDAYLVLSGSRVRNNIRLLWDFGVHIVNNAPKFRPEAATSSHARKQVLCRQQDNLSKGYS